MKRRDHLAAEPRGVQVDVVAVGFGGPETDHGPDIEPVLGDRKVEHRLGVGHEGAGGVTNHLVVEDPGVDAASSQAWKNGVQSM